MSSNLAEVSAPSLGEFVVYTDRSGTVYNALVVLVHKPGDVNSSVNLVYIDPTTRGAYGYTAKICPHIPHWSRAGVDAYWRRPWENTSSEVVTPTNEEGD